MAKRVEKLKQNETEDERKKKRSLNIRNQRHFAQNVTKNNPQKYNFMDPPTKSTSVDPFQTRNQAKYKYTIEHKIIHTVKHVFTHTYSPLSA